MSAEFEERPQVIVVEKTDKNGNTHEVARKPVDRFDFKRSRFMRTGNVYAVTINPDGSEGLRIPLNVTRLFKRSLHPGI